MLHLLAGAVLAQFSEISTHSGQHKYRGGAAVGNRVFLGPYYDDAVGVVNVDTNAFSARGWC